jgi:hypothetical protein
VRSAVQFWQASTGVPSPHVSLKSQNGHDSHSLTGQSPITLTSSTTIQSIHAQLPRRRAEPSRQPCTLVTPPAKGDLIRCLWSSVSWFMIG